MHHNKETQKEVILIEAVVWIFWAVVFIVSYVFAQVTF